jgi:hypothetical protein
MTTKDIIEQIKHDLNTKKIIVVNHDGYRYYTDTATQSLVVPLTEPKETAAAYKKIFIDGSINDIKSVDNLFDRLPRCYMFIGQPDTGKTYHAEQIAKQCNIIPLFKMCRDNLNLETLLEDFVLEEGKPSFKESLAIKMMSGTEKSIIIFDEFNTLLTGVMKTFQPILDDTSTTFEYRGKVYNKNLNCKFIVTLNDKDKGISIVPDAILSRVLIKQFNPVDLKTISKWTNTKLEYIQLLYDIYKICGLLNVFGTRQIKMLQNLNDTLAIKNHLYGLCIMKNIDPKVLDTLQVQTMFNKL